MVVLGLLPIYIATPIILHSANDDYNNNGYLIRAHNI